MKADYDVIVCGGGMVGAAVANLAARSIPELRIAIVETHALQSFDSSAEIDLRVSSISRASERILDACGAWQALPADRISPYTQMCVWDASTPPPRDDQGSGIRFDCAEIGEPNLGYIIENLAIQSALLQAASPTVEVFAPATVRTLNITTDVAELRLDDGAVLSTRLLVGADGACSTIRRLARIETSGHRYDQKAVVSLLTTEIDHEQTAWQRFLPTGPLAFLPLVDGHSALVWSTIGAHANELLSVDDATFNDSVGHASDHILGRITASDRRAAFPLQWLNALAYCRERIVLVGDAAHAIHPLAGQGVNLGLLDAAALVEVLSAADDDGADLGDRAVLRRYERWRKGENLLMGTALDGFKRLFGNTNPMVTRLRTGGLTLVDRVLPLKEFFIRRALGLAGDLPAVARKPHAA